MGLYNPLVPDRTISTLCTTRRGGRRTPRGIGIHPEEGASQPHRGPILSPPLHTQGWRVGGSPGNGIQLQRRVVARPAPLATVLSGTRSGTREMPTMTNAGAQDGDRSPWGDKRRAKKTYIDPYTGQAAGKSIRLKRHPRNHPIWREAGRIISP